MASLHKKKKKKSICETENGPKIGVITVVQLFPLAWEANGGV